MEIILKKEQKQEAQEFVDLLAVLNDREMQELKMLMKAISYVKRNMSEFKIA